jgi:cell division septation protein DedD
MKSKGYPAFIKQKESPDNKNWYRVRVGTFSSRGEAAEYGNLIKEKESGIKSVFITVNN